MTPEIVCGSLFKQDAEVIVNPWNRNFIPWWALIPNGVTADIRKQGGIQPFKEITKYGVIPLGDARLTSAGNLPYKAIIHVAAVNALWVATEYSVKRSVTTAIRTVNSVGFKSVAFPLIGAGAEKQNSAWSLKLMLEALENVTTSAKVYIVTDEALDLDQQMDTSSQ